MCLGVPVTPTKQTAFNRIPNPVLDHKGSLLLADRQIQRPLRLVVEEIVTGEPYLCITSLDRKVYRPYNLPRKQSKQQIAYPSSGNTTGGGVP